MRVAVGSKNKVKLEAVRTAFQKMWPDETIEVEGASVESGVADQPMSTEETLTGAQNRAKAALDQTKADYGVGIEGGMERVADRWIERTWVVVKDASGREGFGGSVSVEVPPTVSQPIEQGQNMSDAADAAFGHQNCGENIGFFGLFTNENVTRTSAYVEAVTVAAAPFVHPEQYK